MHQSLIRWLKPGDRLVEVEGRCIEGSKSSINEVLKKLAAEKKPAVRFRVRSPKDEMADFEENLKFYKQPRSMTYLMNASHLWINFHSVLDNGSGQERSVVLKQLHQLASFVLLCVFSSINCLLICTDEDVSLSKQIEKHLPHIAPCQCIVTNDDCFPDPGTVNYQYLLPVITSNLLESRKASGTVSSFLKKTKEWRNQILPFLFGVKAEDVVQKLPALSGTKLFQFDINSLSPDEFPTLSSPAELTFSMSDEFEPDEGFASEDKNSLPTEEAPIVLKTERHSFKGSICVC